MQFKKHWKTALLTAGALMLAGSAMAAGLVITDADGNPTWHVFTYYDAAGNPIGGIDYACNGTRTKWGTTTGSTSSTHESGTCD